MGVEKIFPSLRIKRCIVRRRDLFKLATLLQYEYDGLNQSVQRREDIRAELDNAERGNYE